MEVTDQFVRCSRKSVTLDFPNIMGNFNLGIPKISVISESDISENLCSSLGVLPLHFRSYVGVGSLSGGYYVELQSLPDLTNRLGPSQLFVKTEFVKSDRDCILNKCLQINGQGGGGKGGTPPDELTLAHVWKRGLLKLQCSPELTNSVLTNHPGLTNRF